jgi:hypothetical protein
VLLLDQFDGQAARHSLLLLIHSFLNEESKARTSNKLTSLNGDSNHEPATSHSASAGYDDFPVAS